MALQLDELFPSNLPPLSTGGNITHGWSRPLHMLLVSRPQQSFLLRKRLSQKNVGFGSLKIGRLPGPATRAEDVVGAAKAQAFRPSTLCMVQESKSLHPAPKTPSVPYHLVWLRLRKRISGTGEARGKLVASLEPARSQTPSCQVSSSSAGPSPHKRPVKLEGPLYFRGEKLIPIINRL